MFTGDKRYRVEEEVLGLDIPVVITKLATNTQQRV